MNDKNTKTIIAIIMAIAGVFIILYHQKVQNDTIKNNEQIRGIFTKINLNLTNIQYNILRSNYYLYYNNDEILKNGKSIHKLIEKLLNNEILKNETHKQTYRKIKKMKEDLKIFEKNIFAFLSLNAVLKNSNTILPRYSMQTNRMLDKKNPLEAKAINTLVNVNFSLFIMKNSMDKNFIKQLKKYNIKLKKILENITDSNKKRHIKIITKHLDIFIINFPKYSKILDKILNTKLTKELQDIENTYMTESARELKKVNQLDNFLLLLYLMGIVIILYFIFKSEREKSLLQSLYTKLKESYIKDHLTGLKNKKGFDLDLEKMGDNPSIILINIDKFSHINDFFGIEIGDSVLMVCAKIIKNFSEKLENSSAYRFGGDEFGILFECDKNCNLLDISQEIIEYFENNTLNIQNIPIDISVSIGINSGKDKLFEKAEVALIRARKSTRRRYFLYDESLDMTKKIKENLESIKRLKNAISKDNIIPYFQPIVDTQSKKIIKYEALARLRDENGKILSPFFFIDAAYEAKLSGVITMIMLKNVLKIAKDTDMNFSINFSTDDILDSQDSKNILNLIDSHREIADKITFEILESEDIQDRDYEAIIEFITKIKSYGCEVAIDDFGSGYSNFEKLLKLDIDLLKIDGTLIKNIDKDKNAELIVKTMINFSKNAGIRVVAEFVHSKEVLAKLKELDIDYVQGYYLGEPKPKPETKILHEDLL